MASDEQVSRVEFEPAKSRAQERRERGTVRSRTKKPPLKDRIPVLPRLEVDADAIRKPDQRAIAVVKMRILSVPFHEIARQLEYASAGDAKQAYINALANMFPNEDAKTLRQVEAMRAEQLLERSLAMASADYFVDANDPDVKIPNNEKLRWHEQAGKDLALHAAITGAKAPTRVEVSASSEELNDIVQDLIAARGDQLAIEANVFDIEQMPVEAEVMED